MKRIFIALFFLFSAYYGQSQGMYKPSASEVSTLPQWAQMMYSENPNVWTVDSLYQEYYRSHEFEKSYHTQYYKRWKRTVNNWIDEQGYVNKPTQQQLQAQDSEYLKKLKSSANVRSGQWTVVGPIQVKGGDGSTKGSQTNVYSIDQCLGSPDILYSGTEPGEVYKSTDHGLNWTCSSMAVDFGGGVSAIEVHHTNPDIAFAGSGSKLMKTTDGGLTWTTVLQQGSLDVNEILINPLDDQVVLAATNKGLYRSTDGGAIFTQLFTDACFDIKPNTANASTIYLLKHNPTLIRAEFFLSSDMGATWTQKDNGWYSSTDPARNDGGARLAVTAADPLRIYAYLIGESKTDDFGFIGIYRSNDGGETWANSSPPDGGPYTALHPNLAYGTPSWTYHQGFYNCAIMVDQTNADHLLIGGLNLWRSDDGGATFSVQAGYQGNALDMHVDMQDFRAFNNEYWITNDGGIYWSDNFFTGTNDVKMSGIHGSDYWGFGSGWNEDVLVGGLYHNGNLAWYQEYDEGEFLNLGGGEASTGYVNPSEGRRTYFSDIGGKILPDSIGKPIGWFSVGMYPNEAYWAAESSEFEFHPACYNIIFLGKENKLWKSTNGGTAFNLVKEFGTDINSQVKYIEISRSNPNVIYLSQQPASGNNGSLWKTTDGGLTWTALTKPTGNSRKMLLAVSPDDANIVWLAYPQASNGNKIYKSMDGGTSWINLTTSVLNNESVQSISQIGGTLGGIYYCTNKAVYYRNDPMDNWQLASQGLPTYISTDIARPFYRDGKLRIASYGKGIWETPFVEQPTRPIAQIMVNQLSEVIHCTTDTFYFDDHSMLNHYNATWNWTFQGGTPATSSLRNPKVVFNTSGNHLVTLIVADSSGNSDTDSLIINLSNYIIPTTVNQGFEGLFPPSGWEIFNPDHDVTWSVSNSAGGFGWSARSAMFDNFNYDATGKFDDLRCSVDLTNANNSKLLFDVAYAKWGSGYADTLAVLVSTDCGLTYTQLYKKGGDDLATAPDNQNFFYPSISQWRTDTIDVSAFIGHPDVMIAFRNICRYGNAVYIDNPRTQSAYTGISQVDKGVSFATVYPNPAISGGKVFLASSETGPFKVEFIDGTGKQVKECKLMANETLNIDATVFKPGVYHYRITGKKIMQQGKLIVTSGRK